MKIKKKSAFIASGVNIKRKNRKEKNVE